jgi:hypothetical protein
MKTTPHLIPAILYGGIMDGHCTHVRNNPEFGDRYLFELRHKGKLTRCAYKAPTRTTRNGSRWVLEFDCVVSRQEIQNG